ncbi:MAG: AAA family ATPase [Blastomonas fulva]|uniref:AAA family ATPase n=1 Tax=Blastomonas fulva TaxID=1550728 RepID=UPI004033DA0F
MPSNTDNPRPFVDTSIARHIVSRLLLTHHERGIVVISGPWGIGKTTAIEAFSSTMGDVVVVKVEPGGSKAGASTISVLQQVTKALCDRFDDVERMANQRSVYALKDCINRNLSTWGPYQDQLAGWNGELPPFTIIFDEAQYLSRDAIDYLRFWNDRDRTTTPFPIGLAFIGNPEFSLDRKRGADSVISGAVRSRALFVESLDYLHITETDLTLFVQSRGVTDAKAIARIVKHYTKDSNVADLRNADRLIPIMHRRANGGPVTAEIVESILG